MSVIIHTRGLTVLLWKFSPGWQTCSIVITHQLHATLKWSRGPCAFIVQDQTAEEGERGNERAFLRLWHFSSLLYCNDPICSTGPWFSDRESSPSQNAQMIKKPNENWKVQPKFTVERLWYYARYVVYFRVEFSFLFDCHNLFTHHHLIFLSSEILLVYQKWDPVNHSYQIWNICWHKSAPHEICHQSHYFSKLPQNLYIKLGWKHVMWTNWSITANLHHICLCCRSKLRCCTS